MSQPGDYLRVAVQKKTALENKWAASKTRLRNIIGCIGTSDPHPWAASCILGQLDQVKNYMASVFDEMTAILTPTEQDEFIEDFNKQEKAYNEANSKLLSVKRGRISAEFPPYAISCGKPSFTFFQSAILFDTATTDEVKERYLSRYHGFRDRWDEYFGVNKHSIASNAAQEMLDIKQMPLTLLLERFRRCIFLLSFTGHDRDWKLLLLQIICKCLDAGVHKRAEEELTKVICSLENSSDNIRPLPL